MCGIYLHIPFCDTKCIYCDFYSITNHSYKEEFLECLNREISLYAPSLKNKTFDTVFFGGGTPSLLEYDDFCGIFETLYANYNISPNSEITIEANPGTLNKEKLKQFKRLPINRLSMGVQSFIDEELKFLTRIHSSQQAIDSVKSAQDAGFININIDMIFALPTQTLDMWKYNLEKASSLGTQHISAYSLIFEEGTFLNNLFIKMQVNKAKIEVEEEMFAYTMHYLPEQGYTQYEISNYAKAGFECRHNLKYWEYDDYIGFGPSASSFINNKRWTNCRNLKQYIEFLQNGNSAVTFTEQIDKETSVTEYLFLALRSKGINTKRFHDIYGIEFGQKYNNAIEILTSKGFARYTTSSFSLTTKGYALCDEITTTYF